MSFNDMKDALAYSFLPPKPNCVSLNLTEVRRYFDVAGFPNGEMIVEVGVADNGVFAVVRYSYKCNNPNCNEQHYGYIRGVVPHALASSKALAAVAIQAYDSLRRQSELVEDENGDEVPEPTKALIN
ncbi:hypothetical protein [uncultured Roseobacter sp.]|uniref:hypothetical protein n=1 Tax=uncultured Roseobacter sp. TaxID=114847 RepID=UPI002635AD6D|nr:hypothetical protein [uncultured Roseobacter sp.]